MWRKIHSYLALACSLLILVSAGTGAILASRPAVETLRYHQPLGHTSVADVLQLLAEKNPRANVEKISVLPSGAVQVNYSVNNRTRQSYLNLTTGKLERIPDEPAFYVWINKLHRQFLLGEKGRWIAAFNGLIMTILITTGIILLSRRVGGWKRLFTRQPWNNAAGIHSNLGQIALLPLCITCLTALWLSAATLHLIPTGEAPPKYPESLKKLDPVPAWTLHTLKSTPMHSVKTITYPIAEDWFDVWTVETSSGYLFVDQFTGDQLSTEKLPLNARLYAWMRLLHTAEGAWLWGIVLLIGTLTIPTFSLTGFLIWLKRRRQIGWIAHNASAAQAQILLLVGSSTGTTWQFAKALHRALHQAGIATRLQTMHALATNYPQAHTWLILTATYGDGGAPESAGSFEKRLANYQGKPVKHATLAFGDRAFAHYAAYGEHIHQQLSERFGDALLPLTKVDKANAQTFEQWHQQLSQALGIALAVNYRAKAIKTRTVKVASNTHYGETLGTPISHLRLIGAPKLPKANAGDYLAIYQTPTSAPRLYSLASSSKKDHYLDICVRRQEGGQCSTWLYNRQANDPIAIRIIKNPSFRLPKKHNILMVAAGTGIAPFIGMLRHRKNPEQEARLYWGGRHPEHDALYADELTTYLADGRLTALHLAWSRTENNPSYVQHKIQADETLWKEQLKNGAIIMICGGTAMAQAVKNLIAPWLEELGLNLETLKRQKRYLEDIY